MFEQHTLEFATFPPKLAPISPLPGDFPRVVLVVDLALDLPELGLFPPKEPGLPELGLAPPDVAPLLGPDRFMDEIWEPLRLRLKCWDILV